MSGEAVVGIAVLPALVGVAAIGVLGYAAGSAMSLAVGGGLDMVGRRLETRHAEWVQRQAAEQAWESVVREVVVRNARLGVLSTSIARLPDTVPPPPVAAPSPLVLQGQGAAEIGDWCRQVDEAMATLEAHLVECTVSVAIAASAADVRLVDADDKLAALPDPGPERPPAVDRVALDRVIGRLLPGATEQDWTGVVAAAARAGAAQGVVEARNRLDDLRRRVERANRTTVRLRADAAEAAALLQPLTTVGAAAEDVRAALLEVVAGRRPLDDELRADAVDRYRRSRATAEREYVQEVVSSGLREMGYDVDEGFGTATPAAGGLTVSRDGWSDHAVRLVVDGDREELRAVVIRTGPDGDAAEDARREGQWCDSLAELGDYLERNGVKAEPRRLTPPGTRRLASGDHGQRRRRDRGEERTLERRTR